MALRRIKFKLPSTGFSITVPALRNAEIHRLYKEGTTYRQVTGITVLGVREFYFEPVTGDLTFAQTNEDADVTVVYEGGASAPDDSPGSQVCDQPTLLVIFSVSSDKRVRVMFRPTGDYNLQVIATPGTCGYPAEQAVTVSGANNWTSDPLPDGEYIVCAQKICGIDSQSDGLASDPFTVGAGPVVLTTNMTISNTAASGSIIGLSGLSYASDLGMFPVGPGDTQGFHHGRKGFQAVIAQVSLVDPLPRYIRILKNSTLLSCAQAVNGNNTLTSAVINTADIIEIILSETPC